MSKILTADDFRAAKSRPPRAVDVPGYGTAYVRALTAGERDRFDQGNYTVGPDGRPQLSLGDVSARLVALCACDQDGRRLFTDDAVDQLNDLPSDLVEPVASAAQDFNGMSKRAKEEAAKNSGSAPASSSS